MSAAEVGQAETSAFDGLRGKIAQPSERDWNVYQAVRVESWATRVAAQEFGISQTRVIQIVQRTAAFIAEVLPAPSKQLEAQQLAAGKQLAADRIDYLYGAAMRCFRMSQSTEKGNCTNGRRNYGEMRYLMAASRLATIASTLPLPRQLWRADEETLDSEAQPACESKPERRQTASPPKSKPAASNRVAAAETCSAPAVEQPAPAEVPPSPSSATAAAMLSYVEQSRSSGATGNAVAHPVQQTASASGSKILTPKQAERRAKLFQTG
jgi:hypothetical protein